MKLTFQEVSKLLQECFNSPDKMQEHSDSILEFIREIDLVGTEILKAKSPEYLSELIALIQSCSASMMLSKGYSSSTIMSLSNDPLISMYTTLIIKLTIGLSAMEELR